MSLMSTGLLLLIMLKVLATSLLCFPVLSQSSRSRLSLSVNMYDLVPHASDASEFHEAQPFFTLVCPSGETGKYQLSGAAQATMGR
jgi:hypothetical protein